MKVMQRINSVRGALAVAASVLAACASERATVAPAADTQLEDEARFALAATAPPALPPAGPTGAAVAVQWTEFDLTLWKDPKFQKRFTESFLAETEIEPTVTEQEREHLQRVMELMNEERADKAVELLQKHGGPGASAVFDFTLASLYFQQDELFQAALGYRDAIGKHPKFRRAWKNLALVHVRRGEFEEAAAAFARVIELGGGDGITYGLLGFAYTNLEQHMSAESAYRLAVLLDPLTPDWPMGLARSFFKQKRYAEAATLCGELLAKDPNRADLWLLQANAYVGLGQPRRAAENFEVVDRLGAADFATLTTLGDIYTNEGLYDIAVRAYLRALELRPDGDVARCMRAARILTAQGASAECEALVAGIKSLCGETLDEADRKELLKTEARLAAARGATDDEARILEEVVGLDPLDGDALILLGQYYGRKGDVEQAIFQFERAAGIEAFEADARVRHAQLLVNLGRFSEAVPLLKRAQSIRPRENLQQYLEQIERAAQTTR